MEAKLLAGPVLRRTTRNRVCVWLATSEPISLQLTIIGAQRDELGSSELAIAGDSSQGPQHARLGKNLYVYLLQARPNPGTNFPADEILYYRLDKVTDGSDNPVPLFSEDELGKLVYGSHPLPSFFIPSKLKHLLHGSCRKPHGSYHSGNQSPFPDALSHGHVLLERTCDHLEQRPAVLLLTGDQIYADDVAISLMAMLRERASSLTGERETLPLTDDQSERIDASAIPLHGRKKVLGDMLDLSGRNSGFSSEESESHLFSFGEFAAMYIYSFGNLPAWEPVWDWGQLQQKGVAEGQEMEAEKACLEQGAPLRTFHSTLANIRRLLANVPTYMIFDDHDVTDDWNINRDWYDSVRESPLGRRIVSNALAAYWAFQAWGNDPDNFDKELVRSITQHLNSTQGNIEVGERFDLHTWKSRGWGFSVPTDPPIIAMDSRTQRQYDSKYYPPQLLDRYALDWLRVEWAKLKVSQRIDDDTCPLLVAATPVFGFSAVENLQGIALWFTRKLESYSWIRFVEHILNVEGFLTGWIVKLLDVESWTSNKEGFAELLITINKRMDISRCVFLSGDVHYAFTASASFKRKGGLLKCYQLTSSSLSNEPDAGQSRFLEKGNQYEASHETHWNWTVFPGNYWVARSQLLAPEGNDPRVNGECNLGLVEFSDGLPVSHTLLTGGSTLIYRLPRFSDDT